MFCFHGIFAKEKQWFDSNHSLIPRNFSKMKKLKIQYFYFWIKETKESLFNGFTKFLWVSTNFASIFHIYAISRITLQKVLKIELKWIFLTHGSLKIKTGKECVAHQIIFPFLKQKKQKIWFFYSKVKMEVP